MDRACDFRRIRLQSWYGAPRSTCRSSREGLADIVPGAAHRAGPRSRSGLVLSIRGPASAGGPAGGGLRGAAPSSNDPATAEPKRSRVLLPESCLHPHNPALHPCRVAHKPAWPGL